MILTCLFSIVMPYYPEKNRPGRSGFFCIIAGFLLVLSSLFSPFPVELHAGTNDDGIAWQRVTNSSIENIDLTGLGRVQPTLADLNNDGRLELFLGTGTGYLLSFDNTGNIGTDGYPIWAPPVYMTDSVTRNLMKKGLTADPFFTDVDADGDLDLYIGYDGLVKDDNGIITPVGKLLLYRNQGDSQTPLWRRNGFIKGNDIDGDNVTISLPNFFAPLLIDIDDDGDNDLLSGSLGSIIKYRNDDIDLNQGGVDDQLNTPSNYNGGVWQYETSVFSGITLPVSEVRPFILEKDAAGNISLYLGTKDDVGSSAYIYFYYLENRGTPTAPDLVIKTGKKVTDKDGLPLMENLGDVASLTIVDLNGNGRLDMIIGTRKPGGDGRLIHYEESADVIPPVNLPELSFSSEPGFDGVDGVDPDTGLIGDSYRFKIIYTHADNIGPDGESISLLIDQATVIALSRDASLPQTDPLADGDYSNGEQFAVSRSGSDFGLGEHQYSFEAACCSGDIATTGELSFLVKEPGNNPPVLTFPEEIGFDSSVGVKPVAGLMIRPFTYKVVYTDSDNDPPGFVKLFIDSAQSGLEMILDTGSSDPALYNGNYIDGEQYYYTATLPELGFHSYRFEAGDGSVITISLPESGEMSSPYIYDMGPDLGDAPDPPHISAYVQTSTSSIGTGPRHIFFGYERLGHKASSEGETRNNNLDTFDDAVSVIGVIAPGQTYELNISIEASMLKELRYASSSSLAMLYLNAWADYNGDGTWSPDEKIVGTGTTVDTVSPAGTVALNPADGTWADFVTGLRKTFTYTVSAPAVLSTGDFFIRVRLDYGEDAGAVQNISGGLAGPVGDAQYGEVEDVLVSGGTVFPLQLFFSAEQGFDTLDGVDPESGNPGTSFVYKVVYYNEHNYPPEAVSLYIDAQPNTMLKDLAATTENFLKNGDYTDGEQYVYTADTLSVGTHDYYFLATDGFTTGRLPVGSDVKVGPTVTPVPPIAVTGEASDLTKNTARLSAIVNAGGLEGEAWIEYNRQELFAATKLHSAHSIISGDVTVSISEPVSGLLPNTMYLYRAVADTSLNGGVISYGETLSMITLAEAPVVTTECPEGTPPSDCAVAVSHHTATIAGTVNPNGVQTTVWFEYGTTTSLGTLSDILQISAGSNPAIEMALDGLLPERNYYFRAVAQNNGGTTYGEIYGFRTTKDLPAVTTNPALNVTKDSALLSGSANPHDLSGQLWIELWGPNGIHVFSSPVLISGTTESTISINTRDIIRDQTYLLLPNTQYNYQVKAETLVGVGEGAVMSFVTLPLLPVVETVSFSNVFQASATLTGTVDDMGDEGLAWFEIEADTGVFPPLFSTSFTSDNVSTVAGSISIGVTGLVPNTSYYFRMVAQNRAGLVADNPVNAIRFTTLANPPVICELTRFSQGLCSQGLEVPSDTLFNNRASLAGSVNSNGVSGKAWFIYGTVNGSYSFVSPVADLTGNGWENISLQVTSLASNTKYYYRLLASNNGGLTIGQDADKSFTTLPDPPEVNTQAPSAVSQNRATLKGQANPMGVEGSAWFEYWNNADSSVVFTTASFSIQGASSNTVSAETGLDLLSNTLYSYRLVAVNTGGQTQGNIVEFRTLPDPPVVINFQTDVNDPVLTYKAAPLRGEVNPNGVAATYRFEYAKGLFSTGVEFDNATRIFSLPEVSLSAASTLEPVETIITALEAEQVYSYRIYAYNDGGDTKGEPPLSFTTKSLPPPPDVRFFTDDADNYELFINDNSVAGLSGEVRSITPDANAVAWFEYGVLNGVLPVFDLRTVNQVFPAGDFFLAQSAGIGFLLPNTRYSFRIVAENDGGVTYPPDPGYRVFFTYPDPPVITTLAADDIHTDTISPTEYSSGAMLHGSIDPNGVSGRVWFEYWGNGIPEVSPVTSQLIDVLATEGVIQVNHAVSGLDKNTTYSFRVAGYNYRDGYVSEVTYGSTRVFHTPEEKPIVFTDPVDSLTISESSATIAGRANPRAVPGRAWFYYWKSGFAQNRNSTQAVSIVPDQLQEISAALTGLSPSTVYKYQILARNDNPDDTLGEILTFTTKDLPPPPLPDPPVVAIDPVLDPVGGITPFEAILFGRVIEFNGVPADIWFQYRQVNPVLVPPPDFSSTPFKTYEPGGTIPDGKQVKESLAGLIPGTTYEYMILGKNDGGRGIFPALADPLPLFSTDPLPEPPLVYLADPPVTTFDFNSAMLSGFANSRGVSGEVWFEYGTDSTLASFLRSNSVFIGGDVDTPVQIEITGLTADTVYYFRIVAQNYHPDISRSVIVSFSTGLLPLPPVIATLPAADITHRSAVVLGNFISIDPRDEGGSYWFVYGLAGSALPLSTVKVPYSPNSSTVSVLVSGLDSLTEYSFMFMAENPGGSAEGLPEKSFTTLETPFPIVITEAASSVGQNSAVLMGSITPHDNNASYWFEYGTSTAYGDQSVPLSVSGHSPVPVSLVLPGPALAFNTTYHYRLVGENSKGIVFGDDVAFITLPDAPEVITREASGISYTSAILNGIAKTKGDASGRAWFEYGQGSSVNPSDLERSTQLQSVTDGSPDGIGFFAEIPVQPYTDYQFRAVALNRLSRVNGEVISFKTLPLPPRVTTGDAANIQQNTATLNGEANPNSVDGTAWFQYRTQNGQFIDLFNDNSPFAITANTVNSLDMSITGLIANTLYIFRIVAENTGGISFGQESLFTTLPELPSAVTLDADSVTYNSAVISGIANTMGVVGDAWFEYGRVTDGVVNFVQVGEVFIISGNEDILLSISLSGLSYNSSYRFRLMARNRAGMKEGNILEFRAPYAPPAVTTGDAADITQSRAKIHGIVNPRGIPGKAWFEYGTTKSLGNVTPEADIPAGFNTDIAIFTSNTLSANTTYYYRIYGRNDFSVAGEGGVTAGDILTFKTLPEPPVVSTTEATDRRISSIKLNGSVNTNGAVGTVWFEYEKGAVLVWGDQIKTTQRVSLVSLFNGPVSANLTGLDDMQDYHFRIVASNPGGVRRGDTLAFKTLNRIPTVQTGGAIPNGTNAVLAAVVNPHSNTTGRFWFEYWVNNSTTVLRSAEKEISGFVEMTDVITITMLSPNITYNYKAVAENASGRIEGEVLSFISDLAAPDALNNEAVDITSTTATLTGTANVHGATGLGVFKYWPSADTEDGSSTREIDAHPLNIIGFDDVNVFAVVEILPLTQYSFRLLVNAIVFNENGFLAKSTEAVPELTFISLPLPPGISLLPVRPGDIGVTSALLRAELKLSPQVGGAAVWFEYGEVIEGEAPSYPFTSIRETFTGDVDIQLKTDITGIKANVRYNYRAVAVNTGGVVLSGNGTFTTGSLPPEVETICVAPPASCAASVTSTKAVLTGRVNPMGQAGLYWFEYGTDQNNLLMTTGAGVISGSEFINVDAGITRLTPLTRYFFQLAASNSIGTVRDNLVFEFMTGPDEKPRLTEDMVSPEAGRTSTLFRFTVIYEDSENQAPKYVNAIIDGSVKAMSLDMSAPEDYLRDGNFTNGERYYFTSTLSQSNIHSYKFVASDGNQTDETRLKTFGPVLINPLALIRIMLMFPLHIDSDGVMPDAGDSSTLFSYRVIYVNFDEEFMYVAPVAMRVHVDGDLVGENMVLDTSAPPHLRDGNQNNGEQYIFTRTKSLSPGTHSYYFTASDGVSAVDLPPNLTFQGPVVSGDAGVVSVGENVVVTPVIGVEVTFDKLDSGGMVTVTPSVNPPLKPSGYTFYKNQFFDLSTTASYEGDIKVCFSYEEDSSVPESELKLFHYEKNISGWEDITIPGYPNIEHNILCGLTSSLSPFGPGFREKVTLISLTSFAASSVKGANIITWSTASEIDTEGYNLLRSVSPSGLFEEINSLLISAKGSAMISSSYVYEDSDIEEGVIYYYRLQEVNSQGGKMTYAAISTAPLEDLITESVSDELFVDDIKTTASTLLVSQNPFSSSVVFRRPGNGDAYETLSYDRRVVSDLDPEIDSFTADIVGDRVVLTWSTQGGNSGFNLLRADEQDGIYEVVNEEILRIPADVRVENYSVKFKYIDTFTNRYAFYKLEEITPYGSVFTDKPIRVSAGRK